MKRSISERNHLAQLFRTQSMNPRKRQTSFEEGLSSTKSVLTIIMVLTKNFAPKEIRKNSKESIFNAIKRLIWTFTLNFLVLSCAIEFSCQLGTLIKDEQKLFPEVYPYVRG